MTEKFVRFVDDAEDRLKQIGLRIAALENERTSLESERELLQSLVPLWKKRQEYDSIEEERRVTREYSPTQPRNDYVKADGRVISRRGMDSILEFVASHDGVTLGEIHIHVNTIPGYEDKKYTYTYNTVYNLVQKGELIKIDDKYLAER